MLDIHLVAVPNLTPSDVCAIKMTRWNYSHLFFLSSDGTSVCLIFLVCRALIERIINNHIGERNVNKHEDKLIIPRSFDDAHSWFLGGKHKAANFEMHICQNQNAHLHFSRPFGHYVLSVFIVPR